RPPDPPRGGPVEGGRLQHLGGHGAEPGVDRDHHEREGAPHHFEQDQEEGAVAAVGPGEVAEAEDAVDRAEVGVEQEQPDGGAGDGGGRPRAEAGQHQGEPGQRPDPGEEHGERAAHGEGGHDADRREHHGGQQHLPELVVGEEFGVVAEALEGGGLAPADLCLGVVEQRDQAERVDRVGEQPAEDDEGGGEVEPGGAGGSRAAAGRRGRTAGAAGAGPAAEVRRPPGTGGRRAGGRRHPADPKASFIFFAASPAAVSTSFLPLTISWNIVGRTCEESICAQAGEAGTNSVPAASVLTNGFRKGSSAAACSRTSVKVGRKPIASNISPCAFLEASRFIRSTARVRWEVDFRTPMLSPPARAGATEPGSTPGSGTTAYLPLTFPASMAAWLKSPPIAMAAFPEAKAVTVSLPPMPAHLAAGQLSSPKREVYASMPLRASGLSTAAAYEPPLPVASSPPWAHRKGIAP